MIRQAFLLAALVLSVPAAAAPSKVKVALKTSEGTIVVAVDVRHAPITAKNFLAYVDQKKFDGTSFYRAAPAKRNRAVGLIQGGIRRSAFRSLVPIAHEPTTKTGLRHVDGTISMARREPGTAMGDFFILVGPSPAMDAHPGAPGDNAGYAAFGKVVSGMPVVKRIMAAKTWPGGSGAMKDQLIKAPVKIIEARRVD
ncbi:peptidylprolyl isomerase [Sphingomonas sp. Root710]|uniref:peptidylprolyl isomerase n=1 Tax=Sphingomonas sp. Root710 TaxID=1736594 RepID=UPI0006F61161|nr:peptidylprolyl isomerase [Sphingomonas sp. Root710]KRB81220.1 peptidylprolyl isomerase [Sphingomonas sp. Root710]